MVTMLWKRIKFPTLWYNCYYFTWSDTYFIQLETLLINHPSYIHCSLQSVQPALRCTAFRSFPPSGDACWNLHHVKGFEAELTIKGKQNCKTHCPLWRVRLTRNTGSELLTHTQKHQVLHILSVSVHLVIQHAVRMRRTILSSVTCPFLQYFSTLSHKRSDYTGQQNLTFFVAHEEKYLILIELLTLNSNV